MANIKIKRKEVEYEMNKKTILIICLLIGIGFLTYQYAGAVEQSLNLTKPALRLTISTDTNATDDRLEITNITFEQISVPIYYVSVDTPAEYPDIDVEARINSVTSAPISYWISAKRDKPSETHVLVLTFRKNFKPNQGQILLLSIRMNDFRGKLAYKQTAFYGWK